MLVRVLRRWTWFVGDGDRVRGGKDGVLSRMGSRLELRLRSIQDLEIIE